MAVDYFLKLDGIEGESADDKHTGWIQLQSFSFGGSQTTSVGGTGGSGAGKVDLSDFSIMKQMDKASAPIFKALVTGKHIATGNVEAVKSGGDGKPFLKIDFTEMFVTSQQHSAATEVPAESVSFSFNKVKVEYSTQNDKGIMTTTGAVTYETKANKVS